MHTRGDAWDEGFALNCWVNCEKFWASARPCENARNTQRKRAEEGVA